MPSSSPSAFPISFAGCLPKAPSIRLSCRCSPRSSRAKVVPAARRFAEEALAVLLFALLVLTAVAEVAMPWLMYGLAPGFAEQPEKFDLTVLLTRIAFPYLLCMSVVALLSGVLNSMQRFTAAAAAPILLNVVLIAQPC